MRKEEYKELNYRPSRMESNNIDKPYEALEEFFRSFTLEDCRNHLWELYTRCVMSYKSEETIHDDAAGILFFFSQAEMLVEAAWLLNNARQRKQKIKNQ